MFKKTTLILTTLASLTIANVDAYDPAFTNGPGKVITHIPAATVERTDQNSLLIHWTRHWVSRKHLGTHTRSQEATVYLTDKTTFSGGSRADLAKGRKVHIIYHFEGNRTIADT